MAAQLIDASNGSQLWSQIFEREITSVLEIQEDIARAIADRFKQGITQTAARGATTNPEAYNFYLRRHHAWFHFTGPEARKSIELFQQAVALDPGVAAPPLNPSRLRRIETFFPADEASDRILRSTAGYSA